LKRKRKAAKKGIGREVVLSGVKEVGRKVLEEVRNGAFPKIVMPSRTTDNIVYDDKVGHYVLGDRKVVRTASNVRHLKPVGQTVWMLNVARELVETGKTTTLRDVYYMAEGIEEVSFEDQYESDKIIMDTESVLGLAREDFNVYPEERSSIFGDLEAEYTVKGYEGKRINLTMHPDGVMVGPALATADFMETSADKVIAIEKGAMFSRFVEDQAWKRFHAVLIHTAGQAPRSTRKLIRRLNVELGLPVYLFADADPWGLHICQVIISGSANAAHISDLVTPNAEWAGVYASDIPKYDLPSTKLTDLDIRRLNEIKKDVRYQKRRWKEEIAKFFEVGKKAEQEAFSKYGLSFIVDKYLKKRLDELGA